MAWRAGNLSGEPQLRPSAALWLIVVGARIPYISTVLYVVPQYFLIFLELGALHTSLNINKF